MQSHTACSWGCNIWRSVAETQRPLPAPEVSNTPQGYSFLMFFEIWCAWWSFVFLQLNNCKIPFMFLHVVPCATFGGRVWHFGPIEPRTISNHAALCFVAVNDATFAMQFYETWTKQYKTQNTWCLERIWKKHHFSKLPHFKFKWRKSKITLIQPKQPRPENWVSTTGQGPLKRCPKRCSERMEEKRVTWDELILIMIIMLCVWRIRSCFCLAFYLVFLDASWRENVFIQLSIHLFEIFVSILFASCFSWFIITMQFFPCLALSTRSQWPTLLAQLGFGSTTMGGGGIAAKHPKSRWEANWLDIPWRRAFGRAESGKLQNWRNSLCARNTHKKLCPEPMSQHVFFLSKAYWRCFTVYRQSEQLESFNLQIAIAYISYVGISELSELELVLFLFPGPCFWLWCQMDGSWGAGKQPQTWFKHHSSWVLWNIIVNLFI